MQTPIRKKWPNFKIPYFAPLNAAPAQCCQGACTPPLPPPPCMNVSHLVVFDDIMAEAVGTTVTKPIHCFPGNAGHVNLAEL